MGRSWGHFILLPEPPPSGDCPAPTPATTAAPKGWAAVLLEPYTPLLGPAKWWGGGGGGRPPVLRGWSSMKGCLWDAFEPTELAEAGLHRRMRQAGRHSSNWLVRKEFVFLVPSVVRPRCVSAFFHTLSVWLFPWGKLSLNPCLVDRNKRVPSNTGTVPCLGPRKAAAQGQAQSSGPFRGPELAQRSLGVAPSAIPRLLCTPTLGGRVCAMCHCRT